MKIIFFISICLLLFNCKGWYNNTVIINKTKYENLKLAIKGSIPDTVNSLELRVFDTIPQIVTQYKELRTLSVFNQLEYIQSPNEIDVAEFPELLCGFKNLNSLELYGFNFKEVSKCLFTISNLRKLELRFCNLKNQPDNIEINTHLESLNISRSIIKERDFIKSFPNLKYLNISFSILKIAVVS